MKFGRELIFQIWTPFERVVEDFVCLVWRYNDFFFEDTTLLKHKSYLAKIKTYMFFKWIPPKKSHTSKPNIPLRQS